MPLYEFMCPVDGYRFERLLIRLPEEETSDCPDCGARSSFVWSRVTMRPDTMWAGVMTEYAGYVTSASEHNHVLKQRRLMEVGDRADREAVHKIAADARREKKEKFAKETKEFLQKEFSGKGLLDSFGQVTPEANRPLSDKPLTSTKDERLKS